MLLSTVCLIVADIHKLAKKKNKLEMMSRSLYVHEITSPGRLLYAFKCNLDGYKFEAMHCMYSIENNY